MITSVCNKCGVEVRDSVAQLNNSIEKSFGYGSIYDTQNWNFYMCDNCLKELVDSFKHKPKGYMEDPYEAYGKALNEIYG